MPVGPCPASAVYYLQLRHNVLGQSYLWDPTICSTTHLHYVSLIWCLSFPQQIDHLPGIFNILRLFLPLRLHPLHLYIYSIRGLSTGEWRMLYILPGLTNIYLEIWWGLHDPWLFILHALFIFFFFWSRLTAKAKKLSVDQLRILSLAVSVWHTQDYLFVFPFWDLIICWLRCFWI